MILNPYDLLKIEHQKLQFGIAPLAKKMCEYGMVEFLIKRVVFHQEKMVAFSIKIYRLLQKQYALTVSRVRGRTI